MSYADRSIYNSNPDIDSYTLNGTPLGYQAWSALGSLMLMALEEKLLFSGTDIASPQLKYEVMLGLGQEKRQEIEQIKAKLISALDLKIETHWLPGTRMEKECLFFRCTLDDAILSDYERYSELETQMYIECKDLLVQSKYFDMVAMI